MDSDPDSTQAVFRRANEEILDFSEEVLADEPGALAPFLCECTDRRCTRIVRLSPAEFGAARSVPGHFVVLPGHEGRVADERVVERGERFILVRRPAREHSHC